MSKLKVLSFAAAATLFASKAFAGAYVGGSLQHTNVQADVAGTDYSSDHTYQDLGLGIQGGYAGKVGSFTYAVESALDFYRAGSGENGTNLFSNFSWNIINLKPGFQINDATKVYAVLGYKIASISAESGTSGDKYYERYITTGVGLESSVSKNAGIFVQYDVNNVLGGAEFDTATTRFNTTVVRFGANYYL